jgi:hypothetical protein
LAKPEIDSGDKHILQRDRGRGLRDRRARHGLSAHIERHPGGGAAGGQSDDQEGYAQHLQESFM